MEGTRARRSDRARVHRGFGLAFACAFELPGLPLAEGPPDLAIRLAEPAEVAACWSGPAPEEAVVRLELDGCPYTAERGAAGDHRFTYGDRAAFHLSPDGTTLLCAPADPGAADWRRVLLDSVLATAALLRGFEALHAAAVESGDGVVAILGRTGGGKTTLAAELLRRGYPLVCDDILMLSRAGDTIVGHPAPPLMNLPVGAPEPPGRRLGAIGDELWLCVEGVATAPAPVAGVCLLDRRPGASPALVPGPTGPLDLLAHGLQSGRTPERRAARFTLLADLAAQAPAYVLEADPSTPAAELADLLEGGLPALAGSPAAGVAR